MERSFLTSEPWIGHPQELLAEDHGKGQDLAVSQPLA